MRLPKLGAWKFLLLGVLLVAGVLVYVKLSQDAPGSFELHVLVPSSGPEFSAALEQTVGTPLRAGHQVKLLPNGAVFDSLIEDIGRARSSVHVEMYIWTRGAVSSRVIAALAKREKGVGCRILLDAVGSITRGDEVDRGLQQAGCELRLFRKNQAPTERNHRKLAIIDGRAGYTGGFGVDDRWSGEVQDDKHWRDTNIRIEGPAVTQMQNAFAEDWQEAGGQLIPASEFPKAPETGGVKAAFVRSTASPVVTRAERLTHLAIDAAHVRLWISNAYFVPGRPVLDLLGERGDEHVDVRLLVPGRKSDSTLAFLYQQREYGQLQQRGARIWEFTPSMMHAKTMVIDGTLAIVGSVNLDPLSLDRLEEGALVIEDPLTAHELERMFEQDCARSAAQLP
jgi:cardiolipin synthase